MAVLEIHKFPARILTKLADEITNIDGRIAGLLNSMVDTMYAAKGIGLAAPQKTWRINFCCRIRNDMLAGSSWSWRLGSWHTPN